MTSAIGDLLAALGPDVVRRAPDVPERYHADVAGYAPTCPAALLRPADVDQLSRALAICHRTANRWRCRAA